MIPETQLETWSHQAATARSADAYATVKRALSGITSPSFDVFLQGSYANSTNIRADSDVDVVASMTTTFRRNIDALSQAETANYNSSIAPGTWTYSAWRRKVLEALNAYYGTHLVTSGNKAIRIESSGNRLPIDVLPAMEYRRYRRFTTYPGQYDEGIVFETQRDNRTVINWPKSHIANGVAKHRSTSERFKPYVRIFKNARNAAADRGHLDRGRVPSYFLECLVYNVLNDRFAATYQAGYTGIVSYLLDVDLSGFMCQNGLASLFGPTPEQWSTADARSAVIGLGKLWTEW